MTTPMTRDEIVELMARDMEKTLAYEVERDVLACDLTREEQRKVVGATLHALEVAGYQIVQGWLPIESAPVELETCLLWCSDVRNHDDSTPEVVGLRQGRITRGKPIGLGMSGDWTFTHWQPLLAPPAGKVQP